MLGQVEAPQEANALIEIDPQYPALGDEDLRALEAAKRELEADAPEGAAADPFETERAA